MNTDNHILIPFLNPVFDLINEYINSDLDEEDLIDQYINDENNNNRINEKKFDYRNIFFLLIQKTFISKAVLFPIYNYFSNIYTDLSHKKDKKAEINLNKFQKILKLLNIFYSFELRSQNTKVESSFCFIGGKGLDLQLNESLSNNNPVTIKIELYNNPLNYINYFDLNPTEVSIITIDNVVLINYEELKTFFINKKVQSLVFRISKSEIVININYEINEYNNTKQDKKLKNLKETINNFSHINLLNGFYGQVKKIYVCVERLMNKKYKIIAESMFIPLPASKNGYLRKIDKNLFKSKSSEILPGVKLGNNLINIKIIEKDLFKINNVNYMDKDFNIIDYFGGSLNLLPFADLIKKLFLMENSNYFNKTKNHLEVKQKIFIEFINEIVVILLKCLLESEINIKYIKKYYLFVLCILYELIYIISSIGVYEKENLFSLLNNNSFILENISKLGLENGNNIKKLYLKMFDANFASLIKEEELFDKLNLLINTITYQQLYRKLMIKLFSFNNYWSKKELFFNNDNKLNTFIFKRKQYNYYTKNFQQPILSPILEIENYYPNFSHFDANNQLYNKNENNVILNYNFNFFDINKNTLLNTVNNYILFKNIHNQTKLKCCLVKKTHHIKGQLIFVEKNKKNKNHSFKLYFTSNEKETQETCNKSFKSNDEKNKFNPSLCYGSIFHTPIIHYGIKKIIKSKDITFILIREYFHRVSAIEIFTIYNKSYFFNFYDNFDIKNINQTNIIINKISLFFEKIEIKYKKHCYYILGYYNKKYKEYLYPLFDEDINNWEKKSKYFSNYDKLIYINLFSNRSFNDLFQYPVFPMFYSHIGLERNMNLPIGFQDLNKDSKLRKQMIKAAYKDSVQNIIENNNNNNKDEAHLFNVYYSNPMIVSNYLVRVFPYTFINIEFQGSCLDDPNRLFYSVEKSLKNNLYQNSDLREMIPELFYLPELFENGNNLKLGEINKTEKIDNVQIYNNTEKNKETKENIIKNSNLEEKGYQKYKFLTEMRELLENEKNLNCWINLIFGINQKQYNGKYYYYSPNVHITFENKENIYNNHFQMQCCEFGLIPYQLLSLNFPNMSNDKRKETQLLKLKEFNKDNFQKEHLIEESNTKASFICGGKPTISAKYLEIINCQDAKKSSKPKLAKFFTMSYFKSSSKKNNLINNSRNKSENIEKIEYNFMGNLFGCVKIYQKQYIRINSNDNFNKNNKTISYESQTISSSKKIKSIFKKQTTTHKLSKSKSNSNLNNKDNMKIKFKIHKILNDHSGEIKYIDYNPRLNLFLSYAMDGFINIYTFPKCKLISVIILNNLIDNDEFPLKKVALVSNPFAMVFCYNAIKMFVFNINGNLINSKEIENDIEILPCIDKNFSLINDFIILKKQKTDKIVEYSELQLPSLKIKL